VLVLASHEPVNWMVSAGAARLVAVLLSGHPSSTVNGVVAATVIRIGSASAYASRGADYEALRSAVAQYTGPLEVRSFQGEYSAAHFNVGGY
jgi:hypothetical protein